MKKFMNIFKWAGIVAASLLVLLIVAAVVLPMVLPLDKMKDMAAAKISESINREVKLGKISFNIFTGVKMTDLYIGNRKGFSSEPFISADAIEFRYNLWKLFQKKIDITKVVLVKPEILVEMRADGTSNFSDLMGAPKPKTAPKETAKAPSKKGEPISFLVSRFALSNGKLTQISYTPEGKKVNQLKDLNVDISNISLKTMTPINIKIGVTGVYEGKEVPIRISGSVNFDLEKAYANIRRLNVSAANEELDMTAEISNFTSAPSINLGLSTNRLNIDKFMAILSGSGKKKEEKPAPAPYGQLTRTIDRSVRSLPANMSVDASIDLNNISFKDMKLAALRVSATLSKKIVKVKLKEISAYNGKLTGTLLADLTVSGIKYSVPDLDLKGFDAAPFSNDVVGSFLTGMKNYEELKNKAEGTLDVSVILAGRGVEVPDIIANAVLSGTFYLKNGRVKKLKSLEGIADKLNIETLKHDIEFKQFKADFSMANKIAKVSNLVLDNGPMGDVKITFDGKADVGAMKFIKGNVLALKLHPALTAGMPKEYEAFKDRDGWATLEFELTGALTKPIPVPNLSKPAQKIIDAQQQKATEQVKQQTDLQKKAAEELLKKQLEEKAKQLLKF